MNFKEKIQKLKRHLQNIANNKDANKEKIEDFGERIEGARKHATELVFQIEKDNKIPLIKPENFSKYGITKKRDIFILLCIRAEAMSSLYKARAKVFIDLYKRAIENQGINKDIEDEFFDDANIPPFDSYLESKINTIDNGVLVVLSTLRSYGSLLVKRRGKSSIENIFVGKEDKRETIKTWEQATEWSYKEAEKNDTTTKQKRKVSILSKLYTLARNLNVHKETKERDMRYCISIKIAPKRFVDIAEFKTREERNDFLTKNDNQTREELEAKITKLFEEKTKEVISRNKENRERVGLDYIKGREITPELFHKDIPFKGVQFGNYLNQKERQKALEDTYTSMFDLESLMGGLDITLNGELSIAFGARGRGGKNAPMAHYEPSQNIINLTKRRGAGTLAHEWLHAFDYAVGSIVISSTSPITEHYGVRAGVNYEEDTEAILKVLSKIKTAYKKMDVFKNAKEADKARKKDYWSTDIEMFARLFEGYTKQKLKEKEITNDHLVNIVDTSPVYFAKDELKEIITDFEIFLKLGAKIIKDNS